jgi:hypothetical protein
MVRVVVVVVGIFDISPRKYLVNKISVGFLLKNLIIKITRNRLSVYVSVLSYINKNKILFINIYGY